MLQYYNVYDVWCSPFEAMAWFPRQCVGNNGNVGIVRLCYVPGYSVHRFESCRTIPADKYVCTQLPVIRQRPHSPG